MTHSSPLEKIVVVFGATGFVGRYIVQTLAARGYRVRLACQSANRAAFLRVAGVVGQVEPVVTDIENAASVQGTLSGASYFINAIGTLFERRRGAFYKLHVDFPTLLARCAQEEGCIGGVHVSALGAKKGHASRYAHTKALGEEAMHTYFPLSTIVRPALIFGSEDRFFNFYATWARLSPILPIVRTNARFQPVYVRDVAQAIMTILSQNVHYGKTFELGGPTIYTLHMLMTTVLKIINRSRLILPIPFSAALIFARMIGWLPYAPLTPDQVHLLACDNIVSSESIARQETLEGLGLAAHAFEDRAPLYLYRFRPGGEYNNKLLK